MRLWMKITSDELQLPVAIADTAEELSEITGAKTNSIQSIASRLVRGKIDKGTFVYVDVEEEVKT